MKNSIRIAGSVAVAAAGTLTLPVWAQSAAIDGPAATSPASSESGGFSGNIGLVSLYKFRGQDQYSSPNERYARPALQGGLDYAFSNGFYIGNWNSMIRLYDVYGNRSSVEMDFYGGYKFVTGDVAWDVGVLRYQYPGASSLGTTELYAGVGYKEFALKYSHTVSKRYFGIDGSRGTGYLNLAWSHPLREGLTLQASVGHTFFPGEVRAAGIPNYTDYSLGVAWDFMPKTTLSVAYVGADKSSTYGYINKGKAIVGIKYAF